MSTINPGMTGFDEAEWRESAKDGPSFQFGPAKEGTAPSFDPVDPDPFGEEDAEHRAEWRSAEPGWNEARRPREPHRAEARRPGLPSVEDRNFAMISHAAGAVGFVITGGTIGWLVPLILYLVKKDEGGFAAEQAKEALNFQITVWIWLLVGGLLSIILIGIPIVLAALACEFICSILGAVRTHKGEAYKYPVNLRLIS